MLRPMANLFAVADQDPRFLDRIEQELIRSGEFARVWRPSPGWVASSAPLPEGKIDDEVVLGRGFAFAEGRDRLARAGDHAWLERVAEIADRRPPSLGQLPGDFGFLRFRSDGSALAVRSCGGWAPLYVRRHRTGVAVGTLLRYFPRYLPGRYALDPLICASWEWTTNLTDGRTFLEDVSILPRGTYTRLAPGRRPLTLSYWDPRPASDDELAPTPEHAIRLRELLIETLERDLDPAGRNLLALSGGIDSSALGALAAGTVGRGLSSVSVIPESDPGRSRDLSYIDSLTSAFGIRPARKLERSRENRRRWLNTCPALPFQTSHPVLCELPRICADQEVRVMIGGEFADEVCGHLARITDWVRVTPVTVLVRRTSKLPFGNRDRLRWIKRRPLDLIGRPPLPFRNQLWKWVHPAVAEEYRKSQRTLQRRSGRRPFAELAVHAAADGWVAMGWEAATPLGVRRSFPFFTRECLELAFRCHPEELLGPGPKRLLREALHGDVPPHALYRPDKGGWGATVGRRRAASNRRQPPAGDQELPGPARPVVRPDWYPRPPRGQLDAGLVRLAQLARYVE